MERSEREMMRGQRIAGCAMAGILLMAMTACSSDQPKPLAQPTPDQVRGHADRAFEKLKQEEQGRTAQPPAPGY
jgi:orotate phosphoribosyltransferase